MDLLSLWQLPANTPIYRYQYPNGFAVYWAVHEGKRILLLRGSSSLMPMVGGAHNAVVVGMLLYIIQMRIEGVFNTAQVPFEDNALRVRIRVKQGVKPDEIPEAQEVIFTNDYDPESMKQRLLSLYPEHFPLPVSEDWWESTDREFGHMGGAEFSEFKEIVDKGHLRLV